MKGTKDRGITLIALIVTIIVLLILAGVTIMALTGENGLINKITIARKKQLESEAEEKLKLKIMELQTDIVEKEGRQALLEDLNNWTNLESDYYDQEITSVSDSQENTNKLVEIDGYIFEVDENLNIIGIIEVDVTLKTGITYQINSIDGDIMQVTIKIKNASGIVKVITPEGREIIPQTNKEEIAIDYEVTSGNNYTFKVKVLGSEETKEYVLKADVNAKPEIDQNESYAYPLLTKYGMEINKTVEIDYGENTNNYYSIDNGKTWNKYTEEIKIKSDCTLLAKSIIDGEITKESKKEITLDLASDAVGSGAYDDEDTTGYTIKGAGNHYIEVSEEMIRESFRLKMNSPGLKSTYTQIQLVNENKEVLSTLYNGYDVGGTIDNIYEIQADTKYINIYTIGSTNNTTIVYEINVENTPHIIENAEYATMSKSEIEIKNNIKIEYFKTSKHKLYKINDGEWQEYTGTLTVEPNTLIQAKGIDTFGKETRTITSYTTSVSSETIGSEAYDNDDTTAYTINGAGNHYIEVSEEMVGESFRIKMNSSGLKSQYSQIQLLDENKEIISILYNGYNVGGTIDNIYEIQENTKYINIYTVGSVNTTIVNEINIENSPQIIENAGYATITKSGIDIKDSIEIKYFKTSEKKLYKINDEEWKEYTGVLIVEPGTLIQAKGIDAFGKESRTIATCTTSVNSETIGSEAYDNDDTTGYTITSTGNHYIEVSEEMIGESFRILMNSSGLKSAYTQIQLVNENKEVISTIYNGYNVGGTIDNIYEIKENTKYINIYKVGGTTIVYEIQPK